MTDKLWAAFDGVRAEDALKEKTMAYLRGEIDKRSKVRFYLPAKRFAAVFAAILFMAVTGFISHNLYFTETAYIDLDVNPSIELAVNRFDRVIGTYAYNDDGSKILEGLNLENKKLGDAIDSLFGGFAQRGYMRNNGLVSVTLQTSENSAEAGMLEGLAAYVETSVNAHHGPSQVEVYPVSGELRDSAHELDLSPAKYLAIMELQEVDSTATVESCRDHSISELRGYAQEHSAGHHGGIGEDGSGSGGRNGQTHHGAGAMHG